MADISLRGTISVLPPDHHGYCAYFTFSYPAPLIFVHPRGDAGGFTQLAIRDLTQSSVLNWRFALRWATLRFDFSRDSIAEREGFEGRLRNDGLAAQSSLVDNRIMASTRLACWDRDLLTTSRIVFPRAVCIRSMESGSPLMQVRSHLSSTRLSEVLTC
ncbi:MAG TPA: hypothetical protein VMU77_05950 [Acidimicrobiales bacterium]|nr:hypothetical protein [Acidimicrobiales bacterium]